MDALISVIVTAYNRAEALDAVLRSLSRQTDRNFEVIVADDGSGPPVAASVARWRSRLGRPLAHVWHEDDGFRAAEIRNRAILVARGAYCIFLDSDCIARRNFVAMHRRLAERGWFLTGNRVLLSPALTEQVLRDRLEPERWNLGMWTMQRANGGINRVAAMLRLPLGPLRRLRQTRWQGARSCNLAIWRDDLDKVDGFDADYTGWGKEDSDIIVRLQKAGLRRKDGNFATAVIHLWHREYDRSQLERNEQKLDAVLARGDIRARRGLSALAAAAKS